MVSDQRLQPTFTLDLARAVLAAVETQATGVIHLTASGACSWFEFTEEIMRIAAIDVTVTPVTTTVPEGGADRPLNGVLARSRADAFGLATLRPWREALVEYMNAAGLSAPDTKRT
jgi:dTDP-4-dehydrorhamnose reductase